MRRSSFLGMLFVATCCWLVAGPGGVVFRMSLACRDGHMHMPMPMPMDMDMQQHAGPHSGPHPCICDHMADGFGLVVSPTVPAPLLAARLGPQPLRELGDAGVSDVPPSTFRTPPTPPPDTRA
jgi:hypothetical protein